MRSVETMSLDAIGPNEIAFIALREPISFGLAKKHLSSVPERQASLTRILGDAFHQSAKALFRADHSTALTSVKEASVDSSRD